MKRSNHNSSRPFRIEGQLLIIGLGTAVAVTALALIVLSIGSSQFRNSLINFPLLFLHGQEIEIVGKFTYVPTIGPDIGIPGFRDTEGRHYLLSNWEEIYMANQSFDIQRDAESLYHVIGTFSFGASERYPDSLAVVAGQIKVTSMTFLDDDTQFTIPE